jgi:hypothetical protein
MILLRVVIDAHEEAAVLYEPVWFSVLTHSEFAIFGGRSKSHSAFPPSLFRTSEKGNDDEFRKDLLRAHKGKPKYGVGKREKRNAEKTIVSPGTGP